MATHNSVSGNIQSSLLSDGVIGVLPHVTHANVNHRDQQPRTSPTNLSSFSQPASPSPAVPAATSSSLSQRYLEPFIHEAIRIHEELQRVVYINNQIANDSDQLRHWLLSLRTPTTITNNSNSSSSSSVGVHHHAPLPPPPPPPVPPAPPAASIGPRVNPGQRTTAVDLAVSAAKLEELLRVARTVHVADEVPPAAPVTRAPFSNQASHTRDKPSRSGTTTKPKKSSSSSASTRGGYSAARSVYATDTGRSFSSTLRSSAAPVSKVRPPRRSVLPDKYDTGNEEMAQARGVSQPWQSPVDEAELAYIQQVAARQERDAAVAVPSSLSQPRPQSGGSRQQPQPQPVRRFGAMRSTSSMASIVDDDDDDNHNQYGRSRSRSNRIDDGGDNDDDVEERPAAPPVPSPQVKHRQRSATGASSSIATSGNNHEMNAISASSLSSLLPTIPASLTSLFGNHNDPATPTGSSLSVSARTALRSTSQRVASATVATVAVAARAIATATPSPFAELATPASTDDRSSQQAPVATRQHSSSMAKKLPPSEPVVRHDDPRLDDSAPVIVTAPPRRRRRASGVGGTAPGTSVPLDAPVASPSPHARDVPSSASLLSNDDSKRMRHTPAAPSPSSATTAANEALAMAASSVARDDAKSTAKDDGSAAASANATPPLRFPPSFIDAKRQYKVRARVLLKAQQDLNAARATPPSTSTPPASSPSSSTYLDLFNSMYSGPTNDEEKQKNDAALPRLDHDIIRHHGEHCFTGIMAAYQHAAHESELRKYWQASRADYHDVPDESTENKETKMKKASLASFSILSSDRDDSVTKVAGMSDIRARYEQRGGYKRGGAGGTNDALKSTAERQAVDWRHLMEFEQLRYDLAAMTLESQLSTYVRQTIVEPLFGITPDSAVSSPSSSSIIASLPSHQMISLYRLCYALLLPKVRRLPTFVASAAVPEPLPPRFGNTAASIRATMTPHHHDEQDDHHSDGNDARHHEDNGSGDEQPSSYHQQYQQQKQQHRQAERDYSPEPHDYGDDDDDYLEDSTSIINPAAVPPTAAPIDADTRSDSPLQQYHHYSHHDDGDEGEDDHNDD